MLEAINKAGVGRVSKKNKKLMGNVPAPKIVRKMCWFELLGTVSENPTTLKTHHGESTLTVHLYASLVMGKSYGVSA